MSSEMVRGAHHVTRHNTPIHNNLSTASQLSISQKTLETLPEDGNVMPKHAETTIKKLRGLSPRANSTDRAAAAGRRSQCQLLRIEGVTWSAQRVPTAVNLCFLDRSRYFFIQVAPQLTSRGSRGTSIAILFYYSILNFKQKSYDF